VPRDPQVLKEAQETLAPQGLKEFKALLEMKALQGLRATSESQAHQGQLVIEVLMERQAVKDHPALQVSKDQQVWQAPTHRVHQAQRVRQDCC